MEKIFIGADHAAYEEKEIVKEFLKGLGLEVEDCGPFDAQRCDYPDYASAVAKNVQLQNENRGILLCGSGIGVSIVANRYAKVRAALCRTVNEAKLSREHNNSNILCVGARISTIEEIKSMIKVWLETEFAGGRHEHRVAMFNDIGV